MNSEKSVMYGGTFDIITKGHLHIIKKASKMFSSVYVVIADNHSKTPIFSKEDRAKMMEEVIRAENLCNVTVLELPSDTYLVSLAKGKGCNALIRGIRNSIDFEYESNICKTNKLICPEIETIYLMPDSALEIVSSSWVKGLIGKYGWQKVVKNSVPDCIFKNLQEMELNKKIDVIVEGILKENNISPTYQKSMLKSIKESVKAYRNRPYHNYEHILDGFEVFKSLEEHWQIPDYIMLYAWLMHDVDPSEDKSIKIALNENNMPFLHINIVKCPYMEKLQMAHQYNLTAIANKIKTLIEATKHITCEYCTEEEKLIVSVDLMSLGGSNWEYDSYCSNVCDEYREKDKIEKGELFNEDNFYKRWIEGRLAFTKKFLSRKCIYPSSRLTFAKRENYAKENLKREMIRNQDYIDSFNNDLDIDLDIHEGL